MMQRMRGTIVPRVAIHPGSVIDTRLSSTASGMFDVIDVERSGLSDCTSHPYPENHTQREP
jgi:hypothetical protein